MTDYSKDFKRYCDEATITLGDFVSKNRDEEAERLIGVTLFYINYAIEVLSINPTKNHTDQHKLTAYILKFKNQLPTEMGSFIKILLSQNAQCPKSIEDKINGQAFLQTAR